MDFYNIMKRHVYCFIFMENKTQQDQNQLFLNFYDEDLSEC
jgi:hypothetical protein